MDFIRLKSYVDDKSGADVEVVGRDALESLRGGSQGHYRHRKDNAMPAEEAGGSSTLVGECSKSTGQASGVWL